MFNLANALDRNARRAPDAEALVAGDLRLTHAQLRERIDAVAAGLTRRGVVRGSIVAILSGNRAEFLELALAANRIGAAFLPLNVRLAEPEIEYILTHSSAAVIATETSFLPVISGLIGRMPQLQVVVFDAPEQVHPGSVAYAELLQRTADAVPAVAEMADGDLHRLMYTSGTTARPKGVPISYGNVLWKNIAHVAEFGLTSRDRTLMVGPMYHVGAFDLPGISTWWVGGSIVILPRFDVDELLVTIERERPTTVWLAPSMVNAILQSSALAGADTASVRLIIGGGEKMPIPLIERLLASFPNARFADAYGMTETVSGDTFLDAEHTISKIGSVGKPVLHLDVRIVAGDGSEAAVDEPGEVLLRGPKVVTSYWNDPEASAAAFVDGWFHTGDIGRMDADGFLYIVDRKKDMIVSGGENIATSEVERAIYEHPAILEAAVTAMPDERWGEVPCAHVVLKPGAVLSEEELIAHCRERIARFKAPKRVIFLETLPRNPSGKVLKRDLRLEIAR